MDSKTIEHDHQSNPWSCFVEEEKKDFNHPMVGDEIQCLYNRGWHSGKVEFYIEEQKAFCVVYSDNSHDYISVGDIDGVEIIHIEK